MKLRKNCGRKRTGYQFPGICIIYVDSKAPCMNPGPIKWGTVPGIPQIFERLADESEDDFVHRLMDTRPGVKHPSAYIDHVTIRAETMKPELSMVPSEPG
ncbi:MAG: hypothetical protein DMG30_16920 [Acidobacteria bacterium]|nr:MAG: hypothetical protein DMG30_16920 [Acidobacteriota bacterium]